MRRFIHGWAFVSFIALLVAGCATQPPSARKAGKPPVALKQHLEIPVARSNLHSVLFAARDATAAERPFRGADLELFFVLARQAVVALENARLYADLRDYVRRVEDSQEALLRAEKMAAAGRLTASIAHEVNNPLQSVQNCLHLAGRDDLPKEKQQEDFELARNELDRLMKTMQRMLDFYRPGAVKVGQVDILDLLQNVLSLTSQQLGQRHIQVITDLPETLPLIFAVSSQVQQIFFNLILNSLDAMPGGGEIKINAREVNQGIEMIFQDTGPGIPEEKRNNKFEPFYSTKGVGRGLGLSSALGFVRAQQPHEIPAELLAGDHASDPTFRARMQDWINRLWSEKDAQIGALRMRPAG